MEELTRIPRESRGTVLAEGEVTGHYHSIMEPDVELYDNKVTNTKLLKVFKSATLTHQEHKPIKIETPGNYVVKIVREMDHIKQAIRRVKD